MTLCVSICALARVQTWGQPRVLLFLRSYSVWVLSRGPRVHLSRFGPLASEPWGSSCLHLSKTGIASMCYPVLPFIWVLGIEPCLSCLAFPTEPSPQPCSFNNAERLKHLKQIFFSPQVSPSPTLKDKYNIANVCTLFIISVYRIYHPH